MGYRTYRVSYKELMNRYRKGTHAYEVLDGDIPEDAIVTGITIRSEYRDIIVMVYHKDFKELHEGEEPIITYPTFRTIGE